VCKCLIKEIKLINGGKGEEKTKGRKRKQKVNKRKEDKCGLVAENASPFKVISELGLQKNHSVSCYGFT
jgi:hypothetical protein